MVKRQGFTLVELLVYISITAIALLIFINFMADTSANAARARIAQDLQQSSRLILDRLSQEVRSAATIDGSTNYSDPGTLVLTTASGTHTFSVSSGALQLNTGSGPVSLTSSNIMVTHFDLQNTSPTVTINLTLQSTLGTPIQSLQTSTSLLPHRNLYQ